jgi:hypothetical protein
LSSRLSSCRRQWASSSNACTRWAAIRRLGLLMRTRLGWIDDPEHEHVAPRIFPAHECVLLRRATFAEHPGFGEICTDGSQRTHGCSLAC